MPPIPVFVSFDFDHDEGLKHLLIGQAKNPDTPFTVVDHSVKEALLGDWKAKVRTRIRRAEQVIVLCGEHAHTASGIDVEITIAREERKPYFLLRGFSDKVCTRPRAANPSEKMYDWTWPNLRALISGRR